MTLNYQPGCIPGFGMPVDLSASRATGMDLVREIAREVAQRHGVSMADILGERRFRPIVHARQEVAWRLARLRHPDGSCRFSLPQIGAWLGGRHHTTILHAIRAHEKRMGRSA